jgi:hypothetical protein
MKKSTVYIESSVISYRTARPSRDIVTAAHQRITQEWWEVVLPQVEAFVSIFVIEEIGLGDPAAAELRMSSVASCPLLEVTLEVDELAHVYHARLQIPDRALADAYHLALAAWHGMDYLVSWNCSHIASGRIQRTIEEINSAKGIRTPFLCTPEELMEV